MPCQSGCCSQRCSVLSPASSVETLLAIASASSKPMKDSAINLTEPCSQPAATPGTESSAQRPARHPQARPGCHKSPPESRLLHHTESTAGSPKSGRHKSCTFPDNKGRYTINPLHECLGLLATLNILSQQFVEPCQLIVTHLNSISNPAISQRPGYFRSQRQFAD